LQLVDMTRPAKLPIFLQRKVHTTALHGLLRTRIIGGGLIPILIGHFGASAKRRSLPLKKRSGGLAILNAIIFALLSGLRKWLCTPMAIPQNTWPVSFQMDFGQASVAEQRT